MGAAVAAQAGSIGNSNCTAGTFASYASQGSCQLGPLDFFNFELYTVDDSGTHAANETLLSTITITPTWNSTTGFAYLAMGGLSVFNVDADHSSEFLIRFTVDPPPVVGGETMELDPPFGHITGMQYYCRDGLFVEDSCSSEGSGSASFDIGTPGRVVFDPPLATLDTFTMIRLNEYKTVASGFESNDTLIFGIETTTAAPEPAAWMLAASGLLALSRIRRRIA